jgi:substrate import-associated zinc metallohydrolase lipoprotein
MKKKLIYGLILATVCSIAISCYPDEEVSAPVREHPYSDDPIDQYIQKNFIDAYGVAVRYRYVDRYVDRTKRVTPPKRDVVEPMLEFLTEYWIKPFVDVANGNRFFRNHVPAEIVLVGSPMYNNDGTVTLGTADAGARITLTEVNFIDEDNEDWVFRQLGTIYHEFAHIVHQRYNLPPGFQQISPEGYTSAGSWYTLSDEDALKRGYVSPYATSSYNEDFAELVAFLLYYPDFFEDYLEDEPNCTTPACVERNMGREKLRRKYNSVLDHYRLNTGVNLLEVRQLIQAKLEE